MDDTGKAEEHLRAVIKDLQSKLEYRSFLLAQVIPHLEESARIADDFIWFSICEKYSDSIKKFKEEYAKEVKL